MKILDKEVPTESDKVELNGKRTGYVKSKSRTGELELIKVDLDDHTIVLPGVEFEIQYSKDGGDKDPYHVMPCVVRKENTTGSVYIYDEDYSEENNGQEYWETKLVTDDNGLIYVMGLPFGHYKVVETKALPGYSKPENPVVYTFVVNAQSRFEGDPQVAHFSPLCDDGDTENDGMVFNESGAILPGTGGPGTWMFTIGGLMLVLFSGCMFFVKRQHN